MVGMRMGDRPRRRARRRPASRSCARRSGGVSISTRVVPPASLALDEQRAAAAAVPRVRRVAGAPVAADPRHARRRAAAEDGRAQPAVMRRFARRTAGRSSPSSAPRTPRAPCRGARPSAGGVRDVGRLVAPAAVRLRREVGAVGLDQQPVARRIGEDRPQLRRRCGRSRCRTPRGRTRATSAVSASRRPEVKQCITQANAPARHAPRRGCGRRRRRRRGRGRSAAARSRAPPRHGAGGSRPESRRCRRCSGSRARSRRCRRAWGERASATSSSSRAIGSSATCIGWVPAAQNTPGCASAMARTAVGLAQSRADRHHPRHAGGGGAAHAPRRSRPRSRGSRDGNGCRPGWQGHPSLVRQARGSGSVGPRLGGRRVDLEERIEDHLCGVKVDRAGVGGAPGQPQPRARPRARACAGRTASRAIRPASSSATGVDLAAGGGERQPAERDAGELENQVVARGGVAAARGAGERQSPPRSIGEPWRRRATISP